MAIKIGNCDLIQYKGKFWNLKEKFDEANDAFNELQQEFSALCDVNRKHDERIQQNRKCLQEHLTVIQAYSKQMVHIDIMKSRTSLKTEQVLTVTELGDNILQQDCSKSIVNSKDYLQIIAEKQILEEELQKIKKQEEIVLDQLIEIQSN